MPRRTSPRVLYNVAVRWIAANTKSLTLHDTIAVQLVAEMFDVKPEAIARHVWLVRNNRVTQSRTFPLPKALTPIARRTRWIG